MVVDVRERNQVMRRTLYCLVVGLIRLAVRSRRSKDLETSQPGGIPLVQERGLRGAVADDSSSAMAALFSAAGKRAQRGSSNPARGINLNRDPHPGISLPGSRAIRVFG